MHRAAAPSPRRLPSTRRCQPRKGRAPRHGSQRLPFGAGEALTAAHVRRGVTQTPSPSHPFTWPPRACWKDRIGVMVSDLLRPGLRVVFVGTSVSKRSAAAGHYCSNPTNKFLAAPCSDQRDGRAACWGGVRRVFPPVSPALAASRRTQRRQLDREPTALGGESTRPRRRALRAADGREKARRASARAAS
jgi:hypothetical protein